MKNTVQKNNRAFIPTKRLILALSYDDFVVTEIEEKWYEALKKLPGGLRAALLAELKLGNYVTSIDDIDWPQTGSIVITLGLSFKFNFAKNKWGVKKSESNDPHYWSQDVYQTVDGVDHLMIC